MTVLKETKMKICVVQNESVRGDVQSNIGNHKKLVDLAVSDGAEIIIFPELSLTGYEPEIAGELATDKDDSSLDALQEISDSKHVTIGVGLPTKSDKGVCISMVLSHPHSTRQLYSKAHLHADEKPFFVNGQNPTSFIGETRVALAICYEISVPKHAEDASKSGAAVYVASVAKFVSGIEKAADRLSEIASKYSMPVLMSNCVGRADNSECAGLTAVWNSEGMLVEQLDATNEGLLILDTETQEVIRRQYTPVSA